MTLEIDPQAFPVTARAARHTTARQHHGRPAPREGPQSFTLFCRVVSMSATQQIPSCYLSVVIPLLLPPLLPSLLLPLQCWESRTASPTLVKSSNTELHFFQRRLFLSNRFRDATPCLSALTETENVPQPTVPRLIYPEKEAFWCLPSAGPSPPISLGRPSQEEEEGLSLPP